MSDGTETPGDAEPGERRAPAQVSPPEVPLACRFSTDDYRENERVAAWREAFGRILLHIDIAPLAREGFRAQATLFRTSAIGMISASTSPVAQGNVPSTITNDDVSFGCGFAARWRASQLDRTADLASGDGVLMSNSDIGSITFPEQCRYVAVSVQRSALASLVPEIDTLFARRVPVGSPALRMLIRYLALAQEEVLGAAPTVQQAFADHVCDLLALALGATRDAAALAGRRGVPAARLLAIQDDIRRCCAKPDLSVRGIAARHRVSVRYIQRIFEESGATFTEFLTEQRLLAAYKALRRHASNRLPVSTIAFNCGFSDVSHFNRAFRHRFGCTPTDVRKAGRSRDA
jgi:AraC-like DNA-binding protein